MLVVIAVIYLIFCFGCILYADDILLLSPSAAGMQKMLDICFLVADDIDMRFNVKKSVAMRIGARCNLACAPLILNSTAIDYADSVKYLGVYIKSGKRFCCSYDHVKLSFYRAFNYLYSKSKAANSELASVFLLKAYCLPIVRYALDANRPMASSLKC